MILERTIKHGFTVFLSKEPYKEPLEFHIERI